MAKEKMTIEEFELHVIEHGEDPRMWSDDARLRAQPLLNDPSVQLVLENHRVLAGHFEASDQVLANDTTENTFLARLVDIPDQLATAPSATALPNAPSRFFDSLFERVFSFSPMGLTSQAAGLSAVLLMGFVVGITDPDILYQDGEETDEIVDLSDTYFADSGLDFEEGIE